MSNPYSTDRRWSDHFIPAIAEIVGREVIEVDYPHGDSTWPDTPTILERNFGHLDAATVRQVSYENAAALFDHPVPPVPEAATEESRDG